MEAGLDRTDVTRCSNAVKRPQAAWLKLGESQYASGLLGYTHLYRALVKGILLSLLHDPLILSGPCNDARCRGGRLENAGHFGTC